MNTVEEVLAIQFYEREVRGERLEVRGERLEVRGERLEVRGERIAQNLRGTAQAY
jgi:hypothetical protein